MKIKCPECGSDMTHIVEFSIDYSYPYSSNICDECNNEFIVEYELKIIKIRNVEYE
jgi:transposase-like protein